MRPGRWRGRNPKPQTAYSGPAPLFATRMPRPPGIRRPGPLRNFRDRAAGWIIPARPPKAPASLAPAASGPGRGDAQAWGLEGGRKSRLCGGRNLQNVQKAEQMLQKRNMDGAPAPPPARILPGSGSRVPGRFPSPRCGGDQGFPSGRASQCRPARRTGRGPAHRPGRPQQESGASPSPGPMSPGQRTRKSGTGLKQPTR